MTEALHALAWYFGALLFLAVLVALVRWARTHRVAAPLLGSALVLLLGAGLAPKPPQTHFELAKEDQDKKGGESGELPRPAA